MIRGHHTPLLLILALLVSGCRNEDQRARQVIAEYKMAVQANDIPTVVRLADPNMQAQIERGNLRQGHTLETIDAILQQPLRVVRSKQGVAYIGWVPERQGTWLTLTQVVVGEGRAISKYSALRESTGTNDITDWQVSAMGRDEWAFVGIQASERAPIEAALNKIDEALLAAWYFEGSLDAKHAIERQLETK